MKILDAAIAQQCPLLTGDTDFESKHRDDQRHHYGILFDPAIHHRPNHQIVGVTTTTVLETMDDADLENTLVRLNRFYHP